MTTMLLERPCCRKPRSLDAKPLEILGSSVKAEKGEKYGVLSKVVYLSPGTESGFLMCPWMTPGCERSCLGHSSGHLQLKSNRACRIRKTRFFVHHREGFFAMMFHELENHQRNAERRKMIPAVRPNGSSDVPWERVMPDMFTRFPGIRFYDYTKSKERMFAFLEGKLPRNYHLSFSRTECNDADCWRILDAGGTVSIVFSPVPPPSYWGRPVINGDDHDARFFDSGNSIVGLKAKGKAKHDRTGFVVRV